MGILRSHPPGRPKNLKKGSALTGGEATGARKEQTRAPPPVLTLSQSPRPLPQTPRSGDPRPPDLRRPQTPRDPWSPPSPSDRPPTLTPQAPKVPPDPWPRSARPWTRLGSTDARGGLSRPSPFRGGDRTSAPPSWRSSPAARALRPGPATPPPARRGRCVTPEAVRGEQGAPELTHRLRTAGGSLVLLGGSYSRLLGGSPGGCPLVANCRHGALQLQEDHGGAVRQGRRPQGPSAPTFLGQVAGRWGSGL